MEPIRDIGELEINDGAILLFAAICWFCKWATLLGIAGLIGFWDNSWIAPTCMFAMLWVLCRIFLKWDAKQDALEKAQE